MNNFANAITKTQQKVKNYLVKIRNLFLVSTTPLFNRNWYITKYPDVPRHGFSPALHYLNYGGFEGRDPGPNFSSNFYLDRYQNVKKSGMNPLIHFIRFGQYQGKHPKLPKFSTTHMKNLKKITFYYSEDAEFLVAEQIAQSAIARGYETIISDNFTKTTDIGFCNHYPDPDLASFSIIMLHDLGQDQWPVSPSREPNMWKTTPWNNFDIGILPGPAWSKCWASVSYQEITRPHIGVFELGWPKADKIFNDPQKFSEEVNQLRRSLNLQFPQSVLHAPSWESEEKMTELVEAALSLPVNILIKEAYWPDPQNRARIQKMTDQLKRYGQGKIHVIDPKVNITYCLALADIIVSDESNCLAEALLFTVPGIGVSDWVVPEFPSLHLPARLPSPPPFSIKSTKAALGTTLQEILAERENLRPSLQEQRKEYFSHLGHSSELIMDVVEAAITDKPLPVEPLTPMVTRNE